jgi:Schlafen, AlbA_2
MHPLVLTLVLLALGLVIGSIVRVVLPRRHRLSWPASVLAGMVAAGMVGGTIRFAGGSAWISIAGAILGTVAISLVAAWAGRRLAPADRAPDAPRAIAELVAAGESDTVELKSTARRNLHSGQRDEKLELVVVKAVAGFLNAKGGTLVIGVADDGTVVGLEPDYALMKAPDDDRYELWLRDLLTTCLGGPATALVDVSFHDLDGKRVCRVDAPPSPAPVFLNPPKGDPTSEFWVRMGNSTRRLRTDEVLEYHRTRWG